LEPFEMTTISTRQSTDELVTRILGEERKRKAPADKRTPPSDQSLHSWDAPDWSILDDRRGELPDFPLDCLIPSPIDQNSYAHWRNPRDMMRQG
jgi:hypothetical protein